MRDLAFCLAGRLRYGERFPQVLESLAESRRSKLKGIAEELAGLPDLRAALQDLARSAERQQRAALAARYGAAHGNCARGVQRWAALR